MIEIIKGLFQEYGGAGLIIAFIIFYMGGSFFRKSFIKWSLETISTKNFFFRIVLIFLSSVIIPFFLGIYSHFIGNPIDTGKLVEIISLNFGGIFSVLIFIFLLYFNVKKEIKIKDRIRKAQIELSNKRKINREKRQKKKREKRIQKEKKRSRKIN